MINNNYAHTDWLRSNVKGGDVCGAISLRAHVLPALPKESPDSVLAKVRDVYPVLYTMYTVKYRTLKTRYILP